MNKLSDVEHKLTMALFGFSGKSSTTGNANDGYIELSSDNSNANKFDAL